MERKHNGKTKENRLDGGCKGGSSRHIKDDHAVSLNPNDLKESRPHISTGSVALDFLIEEENEHGVRPCPDIRKEISLIFTVWRARERLRLPFRLLLRRARRAGLVCILIGSMK